MRTAAAAAILLLLAACTSTPSAPTRPSHSPPHPHPAPPITPSPTGTPSGPDGLGAKVGIILPDRSSRWRTGELTAVQAACTAARLDCVVANARGSATEMSSIAAEMQASGVRILVLVPIAARPAAAIERTARRAGVLTVEYDQHVANGSAAAYVRPDTSATGRLLGRGLRHCPQVATGAVPYARIDAPTSRVGAVAQRAAYRRVLAGTPGWSLAITATAGDAATARAAAAPILRNFSGVRAVLATSDSTAAGVITALTAQRRAGRVAVSGNGATVLGLQHVLAGTQCFTIYHPPTEGAQALVATLVQLVHFQPLVGGHTVAAAGGRRTPVIEYGGARIVTKAGVKAVIDAGYAARADVCTGTYAAACTAAGI